MGDEWVTYRDDWYNERIMETFISAPVIDKQNDLIPTQTMEEAMDFFMKYGVYSFQHEEQPIGLPLAWKTENGKVKIKVGIHSGLEMHDYAWKQIKMYGTKGTSSIRGEATDQEKICEGETCHNRINELGLWSVSWVEDHPANPEAKVTEVNAMAKSIKKETKSVKAPEGYHWMDYKNGPVLMVGDYEPHEGASAEYNFEVIEEHDPDLLKSCGCGCKSENGETLKYNTQELKDKESDSMTNTKKETEVLPAEEVVEEEEVKSESTEVTEEVKEEHEEEEEEEEKEEHEEEEKSKNMAKLAEMLRAALEYLEAPEEDKHYHDEEMKSEEEEVVSESLPEATPEEVTVDQAVKTLKKYGINVYAGKKTTPAPKTVAKPKPVNWSGMTKSLEELELEEEKLHGVN